MQICLILKCRIFIQLDTSFTERHVGLSADKWFYQKGYDGGLQVKCDLSKGNMSENVDLRLIRGSPFRENAMTAD